MLRTSACVTAETLAVDDLLRAVADPAVGGVGMFVGLVRDHDPAGPASTVSWLEYSAHPSAEATLAALVAEVAEAYDALVARAEHRVGRLGVGDVAVTVAVGAAHRAPALEACQVLIDRIKTEVPIWKRQAFDDGVTGWVGL
ncbi:molybdenum cofactor biosynthesis protein MoaE [Raineyella fluvialis]|uniref:Molybdenum cofactor biosynthesis protein MoaE n=1 Tax=Raineyella fluvialis TaxID=2662261 RepID=A0A5Q2FFZ1_9ACTN|nr:molybdenum cofactor biosynthesis protein MoaE [Raineyella fluvialis]QGF24424.1 molybdenum cofactor biosynthesis protein MoaE [Raineyella fluvialis]